MRGKNSKTPGPELTEFQKKAEISTAAVLGEHDLHIEYDTLAGIIPFISEDEQIVLHMMAGKVDLWLYQDEATFSVNGSDDRFERVTFDSTDDLLAALLARLRLRLDLDTK